MKDNQIDFTSEVIKNGIKIKINLQELVETIFISPSSPEWFFELLNSILNKYGYKFNIVKSRLSEEPFF